MGVIANCHSREEDGKHRCEHMLDIHSRINNKQRPNIEDQGNDNEHDKLSNPVKEPRNNPIAN
jgi:hypothetical protein